MFNMVRFTDAMLGNADLAKDMQADRRRRTADAQVLPRPRAAGSAARRPELHLHALRRHDRQRLSPHWRPARSRRRASCSTRTATCSSARTATSSATPCTEDPEAIYFREAAQAHRKLHPRREVPDLPQPVPDERRGDQAGGALREVPRARQRREAQGRAPADRRRRVCADRSRASSRYEPRRACTRLCTRPGSFSQSFPAAVR